MTNKEIFIANSIVGFEKVTFFKYIKIRGRNIFKFLKRNFNKIFDKLESWMLFYGYFKTSFGCSYGRERCQK